MTHEEQDAVVGRTVRELRDIREKLAKLRAKAHEFGDSFSTVAHHMNNRPENLRFFGESTDTRFLEERQTRYGSEAHIPKLDMLEIKNVVLLRDEIRTCIVEEQRLAKSLSDMGFKES